MAKFVRILKIIGRALLRCIFAIGRFFKFTAKKISRNSKTSKLNKKIAKNEKTIQKLYSEIGRNYYDAHSDDPEELLSQLVADVTGNKDAIDAARDKIAEVREAYTDAKAAAKEKAKARKASDKEKARAEKNAILGIVEEEEEEEAPTASVPVFTPPVAEKPAPVFEAPAPVVEEPAPVIEVPAPEAPEASEEIG